MEYVPRWIWCAIVCLVCLTGYHGNTNVAVSNHGNVAAHNVDGHPGPGYDVTHDVNATNETGHDHHGNASHHHGVHLASWNFEYVRQPLIITLFLLIVCICKLGFHHAQFLSNLVPESCLLIILGTIVGAILHFSGIDRTTFAHFSTTLFFLFLLPPIILEAAYSLHDRVFFDNLGTILLYSVFGTILNFIFISVSLYGLAEAGAMGVLPYKLTLVHAFVFGALIVAVDPVAVLAIFQEVGVNTCLYFLVFGESLLNDAVTVVLYNTMKVMNEMDEIPATEVLKGVAAFFTVSLGGLTIGVLFGCLTAIITKYTNHVRVVEPLALFTLAYLSYLGAELFHFSGIISIIGCGLVQAQYAFHNISHKSLTTVTYFSKMASATCDSVIFMFLGLALVRDDHVWHTGFVLWTIVLCLVFRFIGVYFLTFIANRFNRVRKINLEEQFIMAYGGLRGAVAFCLVAMLSPATLPHQQMFETATLAVIIFSVFVQGITIKPLVHLLHITGADKQPVSLYEEINEHVTDHMMAGIEELLGQYGKNFFREKFDQIDAQYLKHWLQRFPVTKDDEIMQLYQKMALQNHLQAVLGRQTTEDFVDLLHFETVVGGPEMTSEMGSKMDLYECPTREGDPHPRADDVINMDAHPELVARCLDRWRMAAQQAGTASPSMDGSVPPSLPTPAGSFRERNGDGVVRSPLGRRLTVFDGLLRGKPDDEASASGEPGLQDIRRWMEGNPLQGNYRKKYDRNLVHDDSTDLLHQLHEKQRRHNRRRRSEAPLSGMSSLRGSTRTDPRSHLDVISEGGGSLGVRQRARRLAPPYDRRLQKALSTGDSPDTNTSMTDSPDLKATPKSVGRAATIDTTTPSEPHTPLLHGHHGDTRLPLQPPRDLHYPPATPPEVLVLSPSGTALSDRNRGHLSRQNQTEDTDNTSQV